MRKKDEQKAENIKATVIKLTREYGFQGISMSKIAKECGVSSSTIYTYYENKSEMIHSIYHDLREKRHSQIYNSINDSMKAEETLRAIFMDFYKYLIGHEDEYYFIRQFASCACLHEELRAQPYLTKIDEVISKFVKSGELVDMDTAVIHAMLAPPIERIAENYFVHQIELSEVEINKVFDLIWKGIKRD